MTERSITAVKAVLAKNLGMTLTEAGHARNALANEISRVLPEETEWQPTKWWRVLTGDGYLWCESSDEEEVREAAKTVDHPMIQRMWVPDARSEWRSE